MSLRQPSFISVDFDGTCVTHEFPNVGNDIGAGRVLHRLVEAGHKLILNTMRSNVEAPESDDPDIHCKPGNYLDDAVAWFENEGIPLFGINCNPMQSGWTSSPKCYAHVYIDDAALGCPLVYEGDERPYVNWITVECMLEESGYLDFQRINMAQAMEACRIHGYDPEFFIPLIKHRIEDYANYQHEFGE